MKASEKRSPLKKKLKKNTGFTWNPKPQSHSVQVFFKFSSLFIVSTFQIHINNPGQDQREGNWTWVNLWNLFTINFKENSQIYSGHITGIWWNMIMRLRNSPPPTLYDLIISTYVKHPSINLPQKVCCLMQSFLRKRSPIRCRGRWLGSGGDTMLDLHIFSHF